MNQPQRLPDNYSNGTLWRYENWPAPQLQPRHVDVWLPPDYDRRADTRYPVIYLHDGQNLFEPTLSFTGIDWGIDEALGRLMNAGVIEGAIAVGIWNSAQRRQDYMPQKPLTEPGGQGVRERFVREWGGSPQSDAYLRFIVDELKPTIDAAYRTLPDQAHTTNLGSSMGGLIALYALCEYPAVFGGAGCVSTHWPIGGHVLIDYFGRALPRAGQHKIYFDYGTETSDAAYEPYQLQMDALMPAAGYQRERDWLTRKFAGAAHTEAAWRDRVEIPLRFLLENPGGALAKK